MKINGLVEISADVVSQEIGEWLNELRQHRLAQRQTLVNKLATKTKLFRPTAPKYTPNQIEKMVDSDMWLFQNGYNNWKHIDYYLEKSMREAQQAADFAIQNGIKTVFINSEIAAELL